jgi:hypothetical protein
MTQPHGVTSQSNSVNRPLPRTYILSLALLSGSGLLLEIALTRLFSTLFYPPYVFAIISLAVLGIGLGAGLATWRIAWRRPLHLPLYLTLAGTLSVILLLLVVWTVSLNLGGVLLALVPLPFLFIGLALATFFSASPNNSPRLYRADLLGAGLGVLLALPLLSWLGGVNSILLLGGLFGLAGGLAGRARPDRTFLGPLILTGLTLVALLLNLWPGTSWLKVDMAHLATAKPISASLTGRGQLLESRWDAFARTDLVDPGAGKPYELYIDGAAGSVMPRAGDLNLLRTDIGFFPFATARPQTVLVIGPGGGLDVWFALAGGAQEVTAVEINPASVELVNAYADYHGDLYGQAEVQVLIDEGRSVLRRADRPYDLIFLSQVVTLAAERSGYALTENTVYTVEAFTDYLSHLRPGGQIALKLYDELTLTRAVVTAATALAELRQITEAETLAHLAVFLDRRADPPVPLLIIQDEPFTRPDSLTLAGIAAEVDFVPLFVPQVAASPQLEAVLNGEATLADIIAASTSDISPTTDDRPFFYQFEPGIPERLRRLLGGLGAVALVGAIGLVFIQRPFGPVVVRYAPLYFAALGIGFITLEIALIQQTRLFLGHPTLAVTAVLAVLLLGGGLGSGWAGRWSTAPWSLLPGVLGGIAGLALLWLFGWPWLSQTFLGSPTGVRVAVVIISLIPLAVLMGIPFPLGLQLVGHYESGDRHVALAWTVNGVTTVIGSALAVGLAMRLGFSSVLALGAAAYILAAVFALAGRSATSRGPS